nr:type I secretion system permease/ATPase [Nitrospira sp.]
MCSCPIQRLAPRHTPLTDTGLLCLLVVARFHDLSVDGGHIQHQFGQSNEVMSAQELLRAAKHVGLKAGVVALTWHDLLATPLPAIAQRTDGRYTVLATVQDDKVLIQDPLETRPLIQSKDEFTATWSGRLL